MFLRTIRSNFAIDATFLFFFARNCKKMTIEDIFVSAINSTVYCFFLPSLSSLKQTNRGCFPLTSIKKMIIVCRNTVCVFFLNPVTVGIEEKKNVNKRSCRLFVSNVEFFFTNHRSWRCVFARERALDDVKCVDRQQLCV